MTALLAPALHILGLPGTVAGLSSIGLAAFGRRVLDHASAYLQRHQEHAHAERMQATHLAACIELHDRDDRAEQLRWAAATALDQRQHHNRLPDIAELAKALRDRPTEPAQKQRQPRPNG